MSRDLRYARPSSRTRRAALAAAGSAILLCAAFVFQEIGYAPCKLCIWQRWPHAVAIVLGLAFITFHSRLILWAGAAAASTASALGMYHVGVEQGWWPGPTSCTAAPIAGLSVDDLLAQIQATPVVRCDDIAWQLAGLSMAGWNALLSLGLALVWISALARARAPKH